MILIRSLSKAEMGAWALFLAVTSIFEAAKSNLLKNAHIRFVGIHEDEQDKSAIAASSFVINAGISLLFILIFLLFSGTIGGLLNIRDELTAMLHWFIPGLVGMVFFSHLEAIQQSFLDFKGSFAGHFARQLLFFGIILTHAILKIPFSLKLLAFYQSISICVGAVILYIYTRKYLQYRFNVAAKWVKQIFGYGGYIFSSGIMAQVFANLDQLMTGSFLSSSAVASYNAASRINGLVDVPSYAASEIIFPKISKASAEEGPERVRYLYEKMVAVLLSFTIPSALFIILFPNFVISIIAGAEYKDAALILQLYMITGLLRPMQNQAANLLNSVGKPGLCLVINAISLAGNLAINYFCLAQFGFYGAAIGTLITCLLGSTAWYFIMKKQIGAGWKGIGKHMTDLYRWMYNQATRLLLKKTSASL